MPSDGLTATDSDISGGTTTGSPDSQSESVPSYIVIEHRDDSGDWQAEYRISSAEAKALLTESIQEADSQQVAIVQGIAADNSEFQTMAITISIVLVFAIFAVLGSIAVDTLVRSFEVR